MIRHIPVLAQEIYQNLPQTFMSYFDGTFGHWGHVEYILSRLDKKPQVIACDLDKKVMEKWLDWTKEYASYITPVLDSYANIDKIWEKYGPFDFLLLDLGVNMEHFKDWERGFSIKTDAPLDMRFDNDGALKASDVFNTYSKEKLEKILIDYGDFSAKTSEYIAKGIIDARKKSPILTTKQLFNLLSSLHFNAKKIAVIFQVGRIETNQELNQLEIFLKKFPKVVKRGGRCEIITYHSIEDRTVKLAFKALSDEWTFVLVNKKVIQPHYTEVLHNKASRSAKLRILQKL